MKRVFKRQNWIAPRLQLDNLRQPFTDELELMKNSTSLVGKETNILRQSISEPLNIKITLNTRSFFLNSIFTDLSTKTRECIGRLKQCYNELI